MSNYNILEEYASDILNHEKYISQKEFIQHGKVSVYDHTINVALFSIKLAKRLKLKVDYKSLVRGCLLHDYFLYDWHINDKSHRLHGFHHARVAMLNAKRDFGLNKVEENMIYTHMFPLNLRIPKYKESVILCLSDKICAIKEMF
jgi:uncharacterized protein